MMHPSRIKLETYRLGNLSSSELPGIEEHLSACQRCRELIEFLEEDAQSFTQSHDAVATSVTLLAQADAREASINKRKRWLLPSGIAVAAVSLVMVMLIIPWRSAFEPDLPQSKPHMRVKGELMVITFIKEQGKIKNTDESHIYHAGDNIFVAARSSSDGYVTVICDNTILIPSTLVKAGVEKALAGSIVIEEGKPDSKVILVVLSPTRIQSWPLPDNNVISNQRILRISWQ